MLVVLIGTWCLFVGGATIKGNEMSKYQAIFSATNAATLTGFQQARNPTEYTPLGQGFVFVLMACGIFFSLVAGGLAVVRIARIRFRDRDVVLWTILSTCCVAVLGDWFLRDNSQPFFDPRATFEAIFTAVSAYGNCGLFLGRQVFDGSPLRTHLLVLPVAVLGGLGLPVVMELAASVRRRRLSTHSRTVLIWSAGAYAVITVGLIVLREPGFKSNIASWQRTIVSCSREAINARSAGFPFESPTYLPQTAVTLLILVMIVGASPGGAAGGLKVTTIAVLKKGLSDLLARRPVGRPLGIALLWTGIYGLILLLTTLSLLITEPGFHLDRTLFLAASAVGNVGLSHDPIVVSDAGLCVLSAAMLVGRVAPVLMLWYQFDTTPEAEIATG